LRIRILTMPVTPLALAARGYGADALLATSL
jgi:hypothetical protein